MTTKEKQKLQRKEKLKKFLITSLHIVAYILSIAFIGLMIFGGIQSCQRTQKVSAESYSGNAQSQYQLKYQDWDKDDGDYLPSFDDLDKLNTSFGLSNSPVTESILTYKYFTFPLSEGSQIFKNNDFYNVNYIKFTFYTLSDGDDNYWCFQSLQVADNDGFFPYYDLMTKLSDYDPEINRYTVNISNSLIFSDNYFYSIQGVDILFTQSIFDTFSFNGAINYNAPWRLNTQVGFVVGSNDVWNAYDFVSLEGAFNGNVFMPIPSVTTVWTRFISLGDFYSNGQLFNHMVYMYIPCEGFIFENKMVAPANAKSYWALAYWYGNPVLDTYTYYDFTIVNYRNWDADAENLFNTASYGLLNSTSWIDNNYRDIQFLSSLSRSQKDFLSNFNSESFGGSGFTTPTYNGSIFDVFTLLSSAFASLENLFSINILAGISIGTLVFLPLVVGIVMTIFYLIKR